MKETDAYSLYILSHLTSDFYGTGRYRIGLTIGCLVVLSVSSSLGLTVTETILL